MGFFKITNAAKAQVTAAAVLSDAYELFERSTYSNTWSTFFSTCLRARDGRLESSVSVTPAH